MNIDEFRNEDNVTRKKERNILICFLEDLRTILATELELEVWRRRNKFNHSHEKIAKDLGISETYSRKCIVRLNGKVRRNLIKLRIRGSSFF
ncbi:MAG: hypothetical protein MJH09_00910 [Cetobacterium sp.]|nr:hypothetical protein [Cetobacterium sp.]